MTMVFCGGRTAYKFNYSNISNSNTNNQIQKTAVNLIFSITTVMSQLSNQFQWFLLCFFYTIKLAILKKQNTVVSVMFFYCFS